LILNRAYGEGNLQVEVTLKEFRKTLMDSFEGVW
jgi:hypothetical protein